MSGGWGWDRWPRSGRQSSFPPPSPPQSRAGGDGTDRLISVFFVPAGTPSLRITSRWATVSFSGRVFYLGGGGENLRLDAPPLLFFFLNSILQMRSTMA